MNYTQNYHLPQWDETDRILRTDFNGAMANLEAGLSTSRDSGDALRTKTLDRFCRMAYNHYRMVRSMDPAPNQIGVFHQDPAGDASGVTGAQLLNGIQSAWNCPGKLTAEVLDASYQQLTQLHAVRGNLAASTPLTATFKPPVSGRFGVIKMSGGYTNNYGAPNNAKYRVTLTNQDTGAVEYVKDVTIELDGGAAAVSHHTFNCPVTFQAGVNYLFQMATLDAVCDMDLNFVPYGEVALQTYESGGTADAVWTLREPEGGTGGMVILHCMFHGAGGELTFTWDGVERKPDITRKAPADGGRTYQEFIFLRDDPIPAESTLSLHADCAEGGSFQFYDWGAMLF